MCLAFLSNDEDRHLDLSVVECKFWRRKGAENKKIEREERRKEEVRGKRE